MFASSKGASTSSSIQNGEGFKENNAKTRDKAVSAFSPPDNKFIDVSFFPGGLAKTTTPVLSKSFSVISKYAFPPLNNFGKSLVTLLTLSKVL